MGYKGVNRKKNKSAPVGDAVVKQQVVLGEATEINLFVCLLQLIKTLLCFILALMLFCCCERVLQRSEKALILRNKS